jgi:hypothetical protein
VGSPGHLLLDEPDPLRRQVLEQNLRANGVTNFTLVAQHRREPRQHSAETKAQRHANIDELCLESLHWIKVNGGVDAVRILDGAAATLWRLRPKLFVAAPDGETLDVLAARVRDSGYQPFKLETPLFNAQNFNLRPNNIFGGKTALALLAVPEETEIDLSLTPFVPL